jgi:hypothetical protein
MTPSLFLFREAGRAVRHDADATVTRGSLSAFDGLARREARSLAVGRPTAGREAQRGDRENGCKSFHGANVAQPRGLVNG